MTAECDAEVRAAQKESEKLGILPEQGKDDIGSHVRRRLRRRALAPRRAARAGAERGPRLMPTMNMIQALNDAHKVMMRARRGHRRVRRGHRLFRRRLPGHRRPAEGIRQDPRVRRADQRGRDRRRPRSAWPLTASSRSIEIQFADYIYPGYDQIVSEVAKMRYRTAGEWTMPMVIRTPYGGGIFGGQTHSQSPESLFTHIAGLKVVIPSTPYDAKGLLIAAIEDPDPVIFFEPKRIYNGPFDGHHDRPVKPWSKHPASEVPEGHYTVPLGKAAVVREGDDADHPRLRHDGPRRARRGRGAGPRRRGHRPAHARPARHRDDRAIGRRRPAAASSSTKRRAPAASAPSSSRWSRSAASIISKRRSSA